MKRDYLKYRLLIYSDSAVYGGHEMTLCDAVAALERDGRFDVCLMLSSENRLLIERLQGLSDALEIIEIDIKTRPGDVFRALMRAKEIRILKRMIKKQHPDLIIVSQGAVGLSVCGLRAAQLLGRTVVSYIPMAHPVSLVRGANSLSVRLQECLYRWLYKLPDYFITTNTTAADWLRKRYRVPESGVLISYYGVEPSPPTSTNSKDSSNITKRGRWQIGVIGRVEYYQKRHDFLAKSIALSPEIDCYDIHILGDGPDLSDLKDLVNELEIVDHFVFHGWVSDVSSWYDTLDLLLLPSRFEGLPLVVLEAMKHGVPIVASDVDGMKEVLPEHWLFPEGDGQAMNSCIQTILANDQSAYIERNKEIILTQFNLDSFKVSFVENVHTILTQNESV